MRTSPALVFGTADADEAEIATAPASARMECSRGAAAQFLVSRISVHSGMIEIFTPSFADDCDTNAQNLTVKQIVSRLDPGAFHVTMLYEAPADPRITQRPNTRLIPWYRHGNTLRVLGSCLAHSPHIYFYPREGPLDTAFFWFRRNLALKTVVVTHVVSGGLNSGVPRPTLARNIREADAVFGNCHFLSQLVRDRLGVKADTIHNGVDTRFFFPNKANRQDAERSSLTVLFAGSLRPYKRVDLVIRQAARWPQVAFRIIGRGEEEERCRRLASELRCSNVIFLGHLTPAQVGEEMRGADIFFFPSILEGHPQVLGQAAASGLPAIAMNAYHPDYVIHEETGFLARSDDELEAKLDVLLTQPKVRRSMAEAAIQHGRGFDWDKITRQWQEAFEKVLAKQGRS
jgi:glycosyltransferase involved in cell wall biosynthesis